MMSLFDLPSASVQSGKDNEWCNQVICGDALVELRNLSSDSIDALCVDPPAAVSFMGKSWDSDKGGRDQWVAWLAEIMRECLRVMKPGAHGLIWSLPRTSHWTAWALEDAGFEVRDCLYHLVSGDAKLAAFVESLTDEQRNAFAQLVDSQDEQVTSTLAIFGSGFPKSHNISIAIDRYFKAEREVIGIYDSRSRHDGCNRKPDSTKFNGIYSSNGGTTISPITAPATPETQKYAGWGSNLKPAVENWYLVRKPLSEKTIAENILKWGTGGLNIDATRIAYANEKDAEPKDYSKSKGFGTLQETCKEQGARPYKEGFSYLKNDFIAQTHPQGRWPSHLLISHSIFCVPNGTKRVRGSHDGGKSISFSDSIFTQKNGSSGVGYADTDGMEEVEDWVCDAACPVRLLDEQSGVRNPGGTNKTFSGFKSSYVGGMIEKPVLSTGYNDQGGASRYFKQFYYSPKASRKDRTANGTVENNHPTVKPLNLIQYLCRMICPPGGIVLDCFAGSGTTALACISEGFDYLLIEQDKAYCEIARARISHVLQGVDNAS